jgi:hypothetical protein
VVVIEEQTCSQIREKHQILLLLPLEDRHLDTNIPIRLFGWCKLRPRKSSLVHPRGIWFQELSEATYGVFVISSESMQQMSCTSSLERNIKTNHCTQSGMSKNLLFRKLKRYPVWPIEAQDCYQEVNLKAASGRSICHLTPQRHGN